jgi:hypothetical protein
MASPAIAAGAFGHTFLWAFVLSLMAVVPAVPLAMSKRSGR